MRFVHAVVHQISYFNLNVQMLLFKDRKKICGLKYTKQRKFSMKIGTDKTSHFKQMFTSE